MIIADRSLKVHQGQTDASVTVRVFMPECDNGTWTTRYEIDWPEGKRNGAARGIDSAQSLLLALTMIGSELYTSDYHKSGVLMWSNPGQGYGFPISQNLRYLLQGDDAKFL